MNVSRSGDIRSEGVDSRLETLLDGAEGEGETDREGGGVGVEQKEAMDDD